jgi:DNA-directed RNA polymerase
MSMPILVGVMLVDFYFYYGESIMNHQLHNELEYSKRMRNNLILTDVLDDIPTKITQSLNLAIDSYRSGSYYQSKQNRVAKLPETIDIVSNIIAIILSSKRKQPIQGLATELGRSLGYHNQISAVKTGAEILALCHGKLYDIELNDDGTEIVPKYKLTSDSIDKLNVLQYLPPMVQKPNDWISNTDGGWLWERKSIILGKGTHHFKPQAYDALNLLQSVAWTIDIPTYTNFVNTNEAMDNDQFERVICQYFGKPFYFVWRYDKRGRSYSSGYDLNVQSNEYGKALLSLFNKKVVTNLDNIKIAIAGHAGQDKLTWDYRIKWFNQQLNLDVDTFDEPILGSKAIQAYLDSKKGIPTGYTMSIDATASGLQVMSALSGCKVTARACNMVNTGNREDIYQFVADSMNAILKPIDSVTRKDVKKPVMTTFYNSEANPKATFNKQQLSAFYEALDDALPGALDVMEAVNQYWDNTADVHMWTLPDGHVAKVPVTEMSDIRIEVDELDHRTFTYRYNKQQPSENYRSLVANIVHSVDGYVAREMVRRCHSMKIDLVHIHDCFVFSPDYLQVVQQTYREILAEIANSDLLSDILSKISGSYVPVTKLSTDLAKEILNSEYMLS